VQLRYATDLTSTEYVTRKAWQEARLERCPLHPQGGCGFARHGSYERVEPPGTRIPRWYCRQGHQTFSLLPDCFAARWSGTLTEVETAVEAVEQAPSLEAAATTQRLEIELPGALRWLRRRVHAVQRTLVVLKGLLPEYFAHATPTLAGFRQALGVETVLVVLRDIGADYLAVLPPPLGFRPPWVGGGEPPAPVQHRAGPDPPPPLR
jgi:hypothetical protein